MEEKEWLRIRSEGAVWSEAWELAARAEQMTPNELNVIMRIAEQQPKLAGDVLRKAARLLGQNAILPRNTHAEPLR